MLKARPFDELEDFLDFSLPLGMRNNSMPRDALITLICLTLLFLFPIPFHFTKTLAEVFLNLTLLLLESIWAPLTLLIGFQLYSVD